jgi:hypothetical protein
MADDEGTSDEVIEALNKGTWDVFKENLEKDAEERGLPMTCPVPAWDELPDQAKEAFDLSMRVNDVYMMTGAIMRHIAEEVRDYKAKMN